MNGSHPQTVFGFPAERGRWLYVFLGLISLLCMGTAYSWSIFRGPLQERFGVQSAASLAPFTVCLVNYALWMSVAGRWIEKIGPSRVMAIGGSLIGLGYLLSGFAESLTGIILSYGVLAGAGVGIAYGVPLAVSSRWFPDKKGLALGITVIGFGLSPLVTAPIAKSLILETGLANTFRILGVAFACIILAAAGWLRFPPSNWHPSGMPQSSATGADLPTVPHRPIWRSPHFRALWFCYAIGTCVGLSAIGISSSVARELAGLSVIQATGLVSLFAVFNGLGRPLFGGLTDRIGASRSASLAFVLIVFASLLLYTFGQDRPWVYITGFCILWMCLGGWLAIAPTATAAMVSPAEYARTYGLVFTAYGVGALLGTFSTGTIRDLLGSYRFAFIPMALLALGGLWVAHTKLPE